LAGQLRNNRKIELDPISTEKRLRQPFAVYGCNGTEFSYVISTEQRNFTTAERRNGNGKWQRNGGNRAQTRERSSKLTMNQKALREFKSPPSILMLRWAVAGFS